LVSLCCLVKTLVCRWQCGSCASPVLSPRINPILCLATFYEQTPNSSYLRIYINLRVNVICSCQSSVFQLLGGTAWYLWWHTGSCSTTSFKCYSWIPSRALEQQRVKFTCLINKINPYIFYFVSTQAYQPITKTQIMNSQSFFFFLFAHSYST